MHSRADSSFLGGGENGVIVDTPNSMGVPVFFKTLQFAIVASLTLTPLAPRISRISGYDSGDCCTCTCEVRDKIVQFTREKSVVQHELFCCLNIEKLCFEVISRGWASVDGFMCCQKLVVRLLLSLRNFLGVSDHQTDESSAVVSPYCCGCTYRTRRRIPAAKTASLASTRTPRVLRTTTLRPVC